MLTFPKKLSVNHTMFVLLHDYPKLHYEKGRKIIKITKALCYMASLTWVFILIWCPTANGNKLLNLEPVKGMKQEKVTIVLFLSFTSCFKKVPCNIDLDYIRILIKFTYLSLSVESGVASVRALFTCKK